MKNIGFSPEECRRGLNGYLYEIAELMSMVEKSTHMSKDQIDNAQTKLKDLKSSLKIDYKLRNTIEGREKMTEVEAAIFAPAIHQALADLSIAVNSRPNAKWHSELSDMQITIRHALESLNNWDK